MSLPYSTKIEKLKSRDLEYGRASRKETVSSLASSSRDEVYGSIEATIGYPSLRSSQPDRGTFRRYEMSFLNASVLDDMA